MKTTTATKTQTTEAPVTTGTRKVKSVTFHAETGWHGKIGAQISITPEKMAHNKDFACLESIWWVPGEGIILLAKDGDQYTIPAGSVKGFEHA